MVSYRLGGLDGVSVEAAKWVDALRSLGLHVVTVAGSGACDVTVAGLDVGDRRSPDAPALRAVLDQVDVVVAENICSLPVNPAAFAAVTDAVRGRPAVLRHHDLPWQRRGPYRQIDDDPAWVHVTVNHLSRRQLAQRGIDAVTVYNAFDPNPEPGDRQASRSLLGVAEDELLFVQPTRAIPRKNVDGGLAVAEALGATYWITGPAEDGFGDELARLLSKSRVRVIHRPAPGEGPDAMAGVYAAADLVLMPSTWEGFGNPAVEASLYRRQVVVGPYPVARELAGLGFEWIALSDGQAVERWIRQPDEDVLEHNREVARRRLSLSELPRQIAGLLDRIKRMSG